MKAIENCIYIIALQHMCHVTTLSGKIQQDFKLPALAMLLQVAFHSCTGMLNILTS